MLDSKRMVYRLLPYLVVLSLFISAGGCAAQTRPQNSLQQTSATARHNGLLPYEQNTVQIARKYKESVVALRVTLHGVPVNPYKQLPPELRRFFKHFQGSPQSGRGRLSHKQKRTERAAGSGFVVDSQHQILTNFHVVSGALKGNSTHLKSNASITVRFPNGKPLPAKVVGVNASRDLALLQLKNPGKVPHGAKAIPLANSNQVQVGEKAIAIGNPFTLQSTVTQGIVSALNRNQPALVSGMPIPYIQTDAPINPGSSGGPLINSRGQVIGVNDEILAPNGTFIGVGFAIPSNLVRKSLPQLKAGKFVKQAMIGILVEPLKKYPEAVRKKLHLPDHGLMIVKVKSNGPGAKAGLKGAQLAVSAEGRQWPVGGDVILKADGHKITRGRQLQKIVFHKHAGETVSLVILRNGHRKTIKVTLAQLKSQMSRGHGLR